MVAVVGSGLVVAAEAVAVEGSPSRKDEHVGEEEQFRLLLGFD